MSVRMPATKRRKTGAKASAVATPVISDGRLQTLVSQNDIVLQAHNSSDLLRRIIVDSEGTELRALVTRIKEHVCGAAQEYMLHQQRQAIIAERQQRVTPAFAQKKLFEDDIRTLHHLFDKLCGLECNANDDKARIAQLATVFSILSIDIDVRRLLVPPSKQPERFPHTTASTTAMQSNDIAAEDRQKGSLIDKSALTLFLEHDATPLITAYRDGLITAIDYVDRCVSAYMSYLPTVTPRNARMFRSLLGAGGGN